MTYISIVAPVFTYCGTVNLNLSKTSLGKLARIHEGALSVTSKPIQWS